MSQNSQQATINLKRYAVEAKCVTKICCFIKKYFTYNQGRING